MPQPLTVTAPATANGSAKSGWHHLGNPYAQPIGWNLATLPAGLGAAEYVYYSAGGANGAYRTRVAGTPLRHSLARPLKAGQGSGAREPTVRQRKGRGRKPPAFCCCYGGVAGRMRG